MFKTTSKKSVVYMSLSNNLGIRFCLAYPGKNTKGAIHFLFSQPVCTTHKKFHGSFYECIRNILVM